MHVYVFCTCPCRQPLSLRPSSIALSVTVKAQWDAQWTGKQTQVRKSREIRFMQGHAQVALHAIGLQTAMGACNPQISS